MDIKGAEILGVKIISVKDNKEIGTVKDIIYDPKQNKVIAFLVEEGDILASSKILPFTEIESMTKEAVLAKSAQSIQHIGKSVKPATTPENDDIVMQDTKIVNKEGVELGKEHDIVFNTESGTVSEFSVQGQNGVKEVKVNKVIASSESTTIVQTPDEKPKKDDKGFSQIIKSFFPK